MARAQIEPNVTGADTLSPEGTFVNRIARLLKTFSYRQSEVLRVSELFSEYQEEVDDPRSRAARRLRRSIQEYNDSVLDSYVDFFTEMTSVREAGAGGKESQPEESTDLRSTSEEDFIHRLQDLGRDLPTGQSYAYIDACVQSLHRSAGSSYLHPSLLMILVGEVEMLVNYLARACFEFHPDALKDSEKSLAWADISQFASVDDIRDSLVDRVVEDLLRGSMLDWVRFFEAKWKVPEVKAAREFLAVEAVQRRHCIVHNAGLASRQYVERMQALSSVKSSVKVDDHLEVTDDYLKRAADQLYLVVFSLAWGVAFKLCKERTSQTELWATFSGEVYDMLLDGRPELARQLVEGVPIEKAASVSEDAEFSSFYMRVNRWIAFKELGRFDEVRDEVAALPVATRSNKFKLAKHALLGEVEEAYCLANEMLESGQLTEYEIVTWPLLRQVAKFATSDQQGQAESDLQGQTEDGGSPR